MKRAQNCEIYIDGASLGNPGPAGIGVAFMDGAHQPIWRLSRSIGIATNNVAEYFALVYALQEALRLGFSSVTIWTDSELLARQVRGDYKVRNQTLHLFYDLVCHAARGFTQLRIEHIPREQNRLADGLACQGARGKNEEAGRSEPACKIAP